MTFTTPSFEGSDILARNRGGMPNRETIPIWQRPRTHRFLLCILFARALRPVVTWVEFSGGMENFNVATAVESARDSHWLMPYLGLKPRAAKPPVLHWITALGIRLVPNSLAWGTRFPSVLASCAMILAVYEFGRTIGDWALGLAGALICGTTVLFLKFAWQASYDLHLALWVTVANWCLAIALFKNCRWTGCIGAGAALGIALMVKGPVAILQAIVPVVAFLVWPGRAQDKPGPPKTRWPGPILGGITVTLLLALPWTIYAMVVNRHML